MNEQEIIKMLESQGYDKVWVYDAEPDEVDEEHAHEYGTRLHVLSGKITITLSGEETALKPGDEFEIPRNISHSAKVDTKGCKYIVAEKHS